MTKHRRPAGLNAEELHALLERREIGDFELTDDQLRLLDSKREAWNLEHVSRDRLFGEMISLHQFWRVRRTPSS